MVCPYKPMHRYLITGSAQSHRMIHTDFAVFAKVFHDDTQLELPDGIAVNNILGISFARCNLYAAIQTSGAERYSRLP